jgi:hypothetical protein
MPARADPCYYEPLLLPFNPIGRGGRCAEQGSGGGFHSFCAPPFSSSPAMPFDAGADDVITVIHGEHVLASWVLEAAPWTAFHSGLIFKKQATGESFVIDYIPLRVEEIENVLAPVFLPREPNASDGLLKRITSWFFDTNKNLKWQNEGKTMHYESIPSKYTNLTKLGEINGDLFHKVVDWSREYNRTYNTFDPVEIVVHGHPERGVSSRMCHDLVTEGAKGVSSLL